MPSEPTATTNLPHQAGRTGAGIGKPAESNGGAAAEADDADAAEAEEAEDAEDAEAADALLDSTPPGP
ncbi:MAG: hypothetical protein QOH56_951 [Pseudonocardiales bacterium]|nr:hypothetical protein [Pseudonocardiales bacterium]